MTGSGKVARVLTVAGSDSGGGAGIQADIKTCAALGVYAMTAITSITVQNTLGVHSVRDVPPDTVAQQIDAVIDDIGVDAVKSGMLSNAHIVEAVAVVFERRRISNYVLDPVMVSESGHPLLEEGAVDAIRARLIPLALLITPNLHEAEALLGRPIKSDAEMRDAAKDLHAFGSRYVLVKGGHAGGETATDVFYDGADWKYFSVPRIDSKNTHGTGCTYSAAIAANLAIGSDIVESIERAKQYVTRAIETALPLGQGAGPLNHGWPLQRG